ncbi:MAG: trypsin-like peptidase domain-containing protein [Elainellaceae cyanobacterium]
MNRNLFRFAASGLMVAGTATTLVLVDSISPVSVLNLLSGHSTRVLADSVDEETNIRVYREASPAVVSIDTGEGTGSGTIISSDGLVLTNAHVVAGSRNARVVLEDGREFEGEVIAFGDPGLDLAAIQIQDQTNLPTIPLAASDAINVGQQAFAIGNPFGQFQGTFTTGIVSRIDPQRGLIQTDAAINPGNSGGPLLNSRGELIGVNTSIYTTGRNSGNIGIGFAIPINQVQPFLAAVRDGRAPREWSRFAGIQTIDINGSAIRGKLDEESNVLEFDRSFFNAYNFQANAGQRFVIDMLSSEIDAYLILLDPNGQDLAQNDDGGNGTNARLMATAPVSGTYTVLANSYSAGESGQYELRVSTAAPGEAQSTPTNGFILQEEGELGPDSAVLPSDGSLYQEHLFEGDEGQAITITMESEEFDTYLILIGPDEEVIDQNDDIGPNNLNSSLTVTLPETGTYRAIANSYDSTGRGRYTLTIR